MNNVTDKIKKLLALSHSDNENEAAQALAAAIRIARHHWGTFQPQPRSQLNAAL